MVPKQGRIRSDHPRACGANRGCGCGERTPSGSSPRVRGKHVSFAAGQSGGRIIPARAGQTRARPVCTRSRTDHPRACGANLHARRRLATVSGSSPRVRGKPFGQSVRCLPVRIIPARAGQTFVGRGMQCSGTDHPRACGANQEETRQWGINYGSSPRVRGKRVRAPGHRIPEAIIPARAGQTARLRPKRSARPDHPRACGANWNCSRKSANCVGSSPRVRGKLASEQCEQSAVRIIPARAGQTTTGLWMTRRKADHPRACGANGERGAQGEGANGSSPRVRGKPAQVASGNPWARIIPARAEQTAVWARMRT